MNNKDLIQKDLKFCREQALTPDWRKSDERLLPLSVVENLLEQLQKHLSTTTESQTNDKKTTVADVLLYEQGLIEWKRLNEEKIDEIIKQVDYILTYKVNLPLKLHEIKEWLQTLKSEPTNTDDGKNMSK